MARAERNQNSVAQLKKVIIQNDHGEKLVGILHETGSKELVIVCHGFQSSKDRIPMVNIATALEKGGISAFRFDFAGNGESEGTFQYGNYRREVDDLCAVVQYFRGEERSITAIVGHSKGGNVVLLYASRFNDIRQVVNISGRFSMDKGLDARMGKDVLQKMKQNGFVDVMNKKGKFQYRVTEENLTDRLTTDTRGACLQIHQDCRVLTVHGSTDKIVPKTEAFEFDKLIHNHRLQIIEGADHKYTSRQNELVSVVLEFLSIDSRHTENVSKDRKSGENSVDPPRPRI